MRFQSGAAPLQRRLRWAAEVPAAGMEPCRPPLLKPLRCQLGVLACWVQAVGMFEEDEDEGDDGAADEAADEKAGAAEADGAPETSAQGEQALAPQNAEQQPQPQPQPEEQPLEKEDKEQQQVEVPVAAAAAAAGKASPSAAVAAAAAAGGEAPVAEAAAVAAAAKPAGRGAGRAPTGAVAADMVGATVRQCSELLRDTKAVLFDKGEQDRAPAAMLASLLQFPLSTAGTAILAACGDR